MDKLTDSTDLEDELTLRIWDGDESALGDLLIFYAQPLETTIKKRFPSIAHMSEDVVAESFRKFWQHRAKYNSSKKLKPYLYTIAINIASDLVSGHTISEKMRLLESPMVYEPLGNNETETDSLNEKLDTIEESNKGITKALNDALNTVTEIQRAVLEAYAQAPELKAGTLSIEFGTKYNNGIPVPAATIRQHKRRAIIKITEEMKKHDYDLVISGVQ